MTAAVPQSQNPPEFQIKPVVLHVHELLLALTTFTAVKVPLVPQVKHDPLASTTTPTAVLHDLQEPDVAESVQIEGGVQTQLPSPLLGAETGQARQEVPTMYALVLSQVQLPPVEVGVHT